MYPGYWGRFFWRLLHCIARELMNQYGTTPLPEEVMIRIFEFMQQLCRYLICPACSMHCSQNMAIFPPRFQTAQEFWVYTIDFHNRVNERTQKLTYSQDEAAEMLNHTLAEYAIDLTDLSRAFLDDFWSAIFLTTFNISRVPDTITDEDKSEYTRFIANLIQLLPFGFADGGQVRATMLQQPLDLTTREKAFESVVGLYNSVCLTFGKLTKTTAEYKEIFNKNFDAKTSTDVIRSAQIREEDHKKMLELQKELLSLTSNRASTTSSTDELEAYRTATIILSVLLGVMLLIGLGILAWRRWQKSWNFFSKNSNRLGAPDLRPLKPRAQSSAIG